ncbi:MAG: hypothetical protein PHE55_11460 [Methylococcaceae bacterium]|nr:hypothetical protein [Methylococcaceae bacterium]
MKKSFVTVLFMTVAASAWADKALFSSSTEEIPEGASQVPPAVLKDILKPGGESEVSSNDLELLEECRQEKNPASKDYSKFFVAKSVPLGDEGRTGYFVRPAAQPYCHAFYGAHLFRYWFVSIHLSGDQTKPKTLFSGASDAVSLLPGKTHGYHDIDSVSCIASGCDSSIYRFDGKRYVESRNAASSSHKPKNPKNRQTH